MGSFTKLLFLLLIVLASQEMMVPSEAKLCGKLSNNFQGACFSSTNCANVCRNEGGFVGGGCSGFQCYCNREC